MLTTALDLLALAALSVFAWFVWQPLPLAVVGAGCIWISYQLTRRRS